MSDDPSCLNLDQTETVRRNGKPSCSLNEMERIRFFLPLFSIDFRTSESLSIISIVIVRSSEHSRSCGHHLHSLPLLLLVLSSSEQYESFIIVLVDFHTNQEVFTSCQYSHIIAISIVDRHASRETSTSSTFVIIVISEYQSHQCLSSADSPPIRSETSDESSPAVAWRFTPGHSSDEHSIPARTRRR